VLYGGAEINDSREPELLPSADGTPGKEGLLPGAGGMSSPPGPGSSLFCRRRLLRHPSLAEEQPFLSAEVLRARVVESESLIVRKSLKIGKNWKNRV